MEGDLGRVVAEADRRFWREWYRDGLPEIFLGLFSLAAGAFLTAGTRFRWVFAIVPLLFLVGSTSRLPNLFFAAKARISDPRTGFVRPRQPDWLLRGRNRIAFVVAAGIAANLIRVVGPRVADRLDDAVPWLAWFWPALLTVPGALMSFAMWRQYGSRRFLWIGVVALVGALWGPLMQWPATDAIALALIAQGVAMLASGGITLRSFLRSHPRPVET